MESACQVGMDDPSRKDVRGIGNGTVDNGHGVEAEEVEEWSNDKEEDLPNGHSAPPGALQVDEQNQQQGPIIRWEGFLPVKTLRVLLVENDDSTRQVVSALLRKCCYEGTMVIKASLRRRLSGKSPPEAKASPTPCRRSSPCRRPCGVGEPDPGGRRSRGGPVRQIRAGEVWRCIGGAWEASPPSQPPPRVGEGEDLRRRRGRAGSSPPPGEEKRRRRRRGREREEFLRSGGGRERSSCAARGGEWREMRRRGSFDIRVEKSHVVTGELGPNGVIPAENGLHAWKYLEDLQNRIDLVLTEVAMPCLSGIGLLSKITCHKICKDVPVIMMSSNDSMSTVFKCLSKGAVDFLVKPIRKNELKNLWQHVWRRCHSSSGSESGIHTQKCAKPKAGDEYETNSGSNHEDGDEDFSIGLNARDGSDNGSGTQSSWTKRAVEIDSPQPLSPDQLADPPDSTCAQVIHPKSERCSNRWLPTANKRNGKKQKEYNDDSMGKYLEIGAPRNSSLEYQSSPNEMSVNPTEKQHETPMPQSKLKNKTMTENDCRNTLNEPTTQTADLISSIARKTETKQAARITDAPDCSSKKPDGNDKNHDSPINMTSQEFGLKRLKTTGAATEIHDERNILKRSDLSAFARYHTSVASNHGGARFGGSCSPQDNSSEAVKMDSTCKMMSNSDAAPMKQGSNGSSNNNDMGSSTKNVITKPSASRERVMSPSVVKSNQHTSAFHPVQHQTSPANVVGKDKADEGIANAVKVGHPRDAQQSFVQHHHHVHYYLHVMTQQQASIDRGSSDAQCGSSTVFDPPMEGHAANYSVNGSISGSHIGSNVQNGSSTAANVARPNMECVNGIMDENAAGGGNGSGSGSGNDRYHNWLGQREAAVNKFRQKRKERNFGKKVRYQSRKRLAEQRPRVRGQFVRQSGQEDQAGQTADR